MCRAARGVQVLSSLHADHIDPSVHVAAFGDAANDVPMFRAIGGRMPCLRVAMPHASHVELVQLATHRAEVATVLRQLCEARLLAHTWRELRTSGLTCVEIVLGRLRAAACVAVGSTLLCGPADDVHADVA